MNKFGISEANRPKRISRNILLKGSIAVFLSFAMIIFVLDEQDDMFKKTIGSIIFIAVPCGFFFFDHQRFKRAYDKWAPHHFLEFGESSLFFWDEGTKMEINYDFVESVTLKGNPPNVSSIHLKLKDGNTDKFPVYEGFQQVATKILGVIPSDKITFK
ncbi:MAG: hypothetical protein JKY60_04215 [Kordiimonadaceae bacterium]|nr:hypothetical protein [Kordiimonadaceae bacterium]